MAPTVAPRRSALCRLAAYGVRLPLIEERSRPQPLRRGLVRIVYFSQDRDAGTIRWERIGRDVAAE